MNKRRRPWGLMGLLSLGGLMMMSAGGDDTSGDDSSGSGGDGPEPEPSDGDHGANDEAPEPAEPDDSENEPPDWSDLPPPPTPKPTKPGTTGGPKPPIQTPDHDEDEVPPTKPGTTGGPKPPIQTPDHDKDDEVPPTAPTDNRDPAWSDLADPYPRGARFYQVVKNDRFGGTSVKRSIAYRFLLSEAYLAALEVGGLSHEDAIAWALAVGKQDKVRLKVIDLIQCSGWNDAMYGVTPVKVSHASAHGRSIRLIPAHGPTRDLLEAEQTPFRNVTMAGHAADTDHREFELLWLPAIDREVLWESGGVVITTTDMRWADGTSMENPPPWVMELGMADESGVLSGDFGCPGADGELEVE